MKIKRTIETETARYDLLDLNREQFQRLFSAYRELTYKMHNGYPDTDELYLKFESMCGNDTFVV